MMEDYEKEHAERMVSEHRLPAPADVAERCPVLWCAARALFPAVAEADLAGVMGLVLEACPECRNQFRPCFCWNEPLTSRNGIDKVVRASGGNGLSVSLSGLNGDPYAGNEVLQHAS